MRESYIEISKDRLLHNLRVLKKQIKPDTKILANLKANAYGVGAVEIAGILKDQDISYFSVAYINEGVYLRKKGIDTRLLIFNPSFDDLNDLIQYSLEPEVSSIHYLKNLIQYLKQRNISAYPIHLKLDTGMHRAGIMPKELPELLHILKSQNAVKLASVFSHLAAAEDPGEDAFTGQQIQNFIKATGTLSKELSYSFFRHLLNTAGSFRFPQAQFDMIRPGLGLFGYHCMDDFPKNILKPVVQLKSKIYQIKTLQKGETVGYNRKFKAEKDSRIGLIPLGYGDGLCRGLSGGNFSVSCRGYRVPIAGTISMDTFSIDLTGTPCNLGDEVVIINNQDDVYEMARKCQSIPYEMITRLSKRLPRKIV